MTYYSMNEHLDPALGGAPGKNFGLCPEDVGETFKNSLHLNSQSQGTSPHVEISIHKDHIALGSQDLKVHSLWKSWDRDSGFRLPWPMLFSLKQGQRKN